MKSNKDQRGLRQRIIVWSLTGRGPIPRIVSDNSLIGFQTLRQQNNTVQIGYLAGDSLFVNISQRGREKGPSIVNPGPTLELCVQRQHFGETPERRGGSSAYGPSRAHRYRLELDWTHTPTLKDKDSSHSFQTVTKSTPPPPPPPPQQRNNSNNSSNNNNNNQCFAEAATSEWQLQITKKQKSMY